MTWNVLRVSCCGFRRYSGASGRLWPHFMQISPLLLRSSRLFPPDVWQRLCDNVDSNLVLLKPVGIAALPPGSKMLRVGQTPLLSRRDMSKVIPEQRRVWVQSCSPSRSVCRFLIPPVRLSVCGLIWPPQAQMSAHSRCRRSLSVRPLRMLALTLFFVGMGGFVRLPDSLLLHQLLGTYRQFSISWQPG